MTSYKPYPTYFAEGRGGRLTDLDGNEYRDFLANYGALVHGHDHPALTEATTRQLARASAPGGPTPLQYEHAERLIARVPSLERVRYCNSGTEATMWAIRTARAFTGRDLVIKMDGGYHGTHDWAEVSPFITGGTAVPQNLSGLPDAQLPRGIPSVVADCVCAVPINDLDVIERVFEERGEEIACVIVEPMMGVAGGIRARPEYLERLRSLCTRDGALLVFDECVTFRLGTWQARFGPVPDLTTLSKIIGGGLPIGVFGGRRDVMDIFDPQGDAPVYHASAFGANSASLAAGCAALDHFSGEDIDDLERKGNRLRGLLEEEASAIGIAATAVGQGSLTYFHFGTGDPRNAAETTKRREGREPLRALVHLALLNRGFATAKHGLICVSIPTTDTDIDRFARAYGSVLEELRPIVEEHHPELIRDHHSSVAV
ncbi:aspartate aminotransferase family protein [Rhodococcus rhodnii]|nr:aspartate aminotransferase family protein [Rhodococcus rhodnii]